MTHRFRPLVLCLFCLSTLTFIFGRPPEGRMAFTVTMERPHMHFYHVVFECEGLGGEALDFKLPAWTPGYYQIMDYARNVLNFSARDGEGNLLGWAKTAKNTWRVKTGGAAAVEVSYDIYAFRRSVAESYLDDGRAFISPTGLFLHVAGRLGHPVTVTFVPRENGHRISTGLDPVAGRLHTYSAPDFDVLYDCPALIGDHEILTFEVQGIPHVIAVENLGTFDRGTFKSDIKRVVEGAVRLIGEIPYRHYTFIIMHQGGGGLEHSNSMAVFSNPAGWSRPSGYKGWLSFIAHEFYHLYNVKRIRPIALGPFDYDRENYTRMLWVSEGISVYYQNLILSRLGIYSRDEYFEQVRRYLSSYENRPGHLFQTAAESSFDTWMKFFSRDENSANTSISYYDKGAGLGLLLDLKIRHESRNHRSLDDVMRTLYSKFYKELQRGFTDEEFRAECEAASGCPLPGIFEEAAVTVSDIDYPKYLAYAGLEIDVTPRELPGAFFGASARLQEGRLVITSIEWDSPAQHGGLSARDEILALDGIRADPRMLDGILESRRPGETLRVLVSRRTGVKEFEIVLGRKSERSFHITPISDPTPLQSAILDGMLKER